MIRPLKNGLLAFVRFFDTSAGHVDKRTHIGPNKIEWLRWFPFVLLHGMCLGVIWVGTSPVAVAVCLAMYVVRMFAITGFYHRYFSHRTFKAPRAVQFLMAVLGNSAAQRGPLWWASHHRHHHKYSDEVEDAHSPHQHGFMWSHIGWITAKKNFATDFESVPDLAKFPELVFLDRFDVLVPVLTGFAMFFLGVLLNHLWPGLETSGMQMLIWGFFVSTILLFHGTCTINSLSHLIGRRRYQTSDDSRNSWILAIITLGEGWHNNHHYYQSSTRNGFYWYEYDVTFYMLTVMSWLGLVRDLKPVPIAVRDRRPEATVPEEAA
ncbi:MAG: acyl-CoA desaturase [Planctomycetes bacterium]|nr:acyl-CoA desaturase [Planctomycetota bacterium]